MAKKLTLHWRLLRHDLLKPDQYHEEAVQQLLGYSVSKQSYQLEESSSGKLPQSLCLCLLQFKLVLAFSIVLRMYISNGFVSAVKGIFVTRDQPLFSQWNMKLFVEKRDFVKLFSVKRQMNVWFAVNREFKVTSYLKGPRKSIFILFDKTEYKHSIKCFHGKNIWYI